MKPGPPRATRPTADSGCLPDRTRFLAALSAALETCLSPAFVAVVVVQVCQFKNIEIEYGYARGDELMAQLAARLASALRRQDVVARVAADTFAVYLPQLSSTAQPVLALAKLRRQCEAPFATAGGVIRLRLASGYSLGGQDADDAESLLRCADVALNHALERHLEAVAYADTPAGAAPRPHRIGVEMEAALGDGLVEASFMPVVDIQAGNLWGMQVMPYWPSPTWGEVDAVTLATIADERGLGSALGLWAMNNALREAAEWRATVGACGSLVYLPAGAVRDPHLPEMVQRAFRLWGGTASSLTLVVDEAVAMAEPEASLQAFNAVHAIGARIALCGFGAGPSSLTLLKSLPIDFLEIAPVFVDKLVRRPGDRAVVQAIIDLAHNFDLAVIAAGVGDEDTLDMLTLMGCRYARGGAVAPALPAPNLAAWLQASSWDAPPAVGA